MQPSAHFGQQIKAIREQRKMSQSELSRRSGVQQAQISRYELAQNTDIHARQLADLAIALGVSMDYLWWGERLEQMKPLMSTPVPAGRNRNSAATCGGGAGAGVGT